MRILVNLLWASLCLVSCQKGTPAVEEPDKSLPLLQAHFPSIDKEPAHQVLVLGSFHFDYQMDASDVKGKYRMDILSDENQNQIRSILDDLGSYKPTKIMIEWPPRIQKRVDSLYQAYLRNEFTPGRSEIYQLGFRLAKELGHEKVYCIDNRPIMPKAIGEIEDLDVFAEELGQSALFHSYDAENKRLTTYLDSIQQENTVLDVLRLYNSPVYAKRSKQLWTTGMVNLGTFDNYAGTDLTGHWYRRNTRIFSNVLSLQNLEQERVLVIYGAMHKWILDELFENNPDYELIQFNAL